MAETSLPRKSFSAAAESSIVTVRDHNRDRLRVDTRLKLLAKWCPKRYGDKLDVEDSGNLTVNVFTEDE